MSTSSMENADARRATPTRRSRALWMVACSIATASACGGGAKPPGNIGEGGSGGGPTAGERPGTMVGGREMPGAGAGGVSGAGGSSAGGSSGAGGNGAGGGSADASTPTGTADGPAGEVGMPARYTTISLYQTSRAGDKLTKMPGPTFAAAPNASGRIAVTPTQRQEVVGFGVSLTESTAANLLKIDARKPGTRQFIIDQYFKPENANFVLTRLHIGSCDFTPARYNYAPTQTADLSNFSIQHDVAQGTVQLILDAQAAAGGAGTLKHVASPWTAPPWMKMGADPTDGGYTNGRLNPQFYNLFGLYIARYVQAYAARGIPIWAVTPQNEPLHLGNFETMGFVGDGTGSAAFIAQSLGPKMAALDPPVKILGFDHNKGAGLAPFVSALYRNAEAARYLAGVATHWYDLPQNAFVESLDAAHTISRGGLIIGTEQGLSAITNPVANAAWNNDAWWWGPNSPDWAAGTQGHLNVVGVYRVASDIIQSFNHWQQGWIYWNAVGDKYGGPSHYTARVPGTRAQSPIAVDVGSTFENANFFDSPPASPPTFEVYVTPTFHVLQHFSKFVLPGGRVLVSNVEARLVGNTAVGGGADFMALAAVNPNGSLAVVVLNEKNTPVSYQITVGTQSVPLTIPAAALQTLLFE